MKDFRKSLESQPHRHCFIFRICWIKCELLIRIKIQNTQKNFKRQNCLLLLSYANNSPLWIILK